MNKSLLEECVRREEIVFTMISGIRLDLNKVVSQIRELDETLVRILRVEEESANEHIRTVQDGR